LFARDAKRRTGNARGEKINSGKILVAKVADVLLDNVPMGTILAERCAELGFVFDRSGMMEPGHFEAEGLPATTRAKFKDSKTHDW
jgi:hypothetical protein